MALNALIDSSAVSCAFSPRHCSAFDGLFFLGVRTDTGAASLGNCQADTVAVQAAVHRITISQRYGVDVLKRFRSPTFMGANYSNIIIFYLSRGYIQQTVVTND